MRTLLVLVLLLLPMSLQAASTPAPLGTGGAVSSGDARATKVGIEILRAGGNAADAAVATALALAVVYPEAGTLGGGGFAVIKRGDKLAALDFRETAPAAAKRDMYLDSKGEPIEDASRVGALAAGVPGSPAGLYELHRKHGRLPWKRIVEPARKLAADGFRVDRHLNELLARDSYSNRLQRFPDTAKVWYPGGKPVEVGSVVRLPALAATLAAYAERGPEAITTGPVAAAVEAASRRHGGVLTAADLAAYQPVWREPVVVEAFGWKLASMPLPSSGGLLLGETLGILERLEWAKMPRFG
ncbi:MAG: gamma-glutamyltransferase, partial [Thermoanaerobaculia bacterium]